MPISKTGCGREIIADSSFGEGHCGRMGCNACRTVWGDSILHRLVYGGDFLSPYQNDTSPAKGKKKESK